MLRSNPRRQHHPRHKNRHNRQPNLGSAGAEERARGLRKHSGHALQDATSGRANYRGTLSNFPVEPMNVDSAEGDDADKDESLSDGISANVGTPQRSTCPSVIAHRCHRNGPFLPFSWRYTCQGLECGNAPFFSQYSAAFLCCCCGFTSKKSSCSKFSAISLCHRILETPTALRRQSLPTRRGCLSLFYPLVFFSMACACECGLHRAFVCANLNTHSPWA